MKEFLVALCFVLLTANCSGQTSYKDSLAAYIRTYIETHEVVKSENRKDLRFYPVDSAYRVTATFEKIQNGQWFEMPTSGRIKKIFKVYGTVNFALKDTLVKMNLYQSQGLMGSTEYTDYLFLPFTDATTGIETYESGRYIDLKTIDISNNEVVIDFNKAYNPYCAYVSGVYNCPLPPPENHLAVAVLAGEMSFGKH
jgi:uncharacterized protein